MSSCSDFIILFDGRVISQKVLLQMFFAFLRPLRDGGPHDVYHSVSSGRLFGSGGLEAQVLGLQLVLRVRTCDRRVCKLLLSLRKNLHTEKQNVPLRNKTKIKNMSYSPVSRVQKSTNGTPKIAI